MPDSLLVCPLTSGFKLEDSDTSLRLDSLGRWLSFRQGECFYRRCLNGDVVTGRGNRLLSQTERQGVLDLVRETINHWLDRYRDCEAGGVLEKAQALPKGHYDSLATLYHDVYPEDVPILPPDRYGDIVVQPAVGCPNRKCTFCAFYRDQPFRVLRPEALMNHLAGIQTLMGASLSGRDGLFIGSANAMALSQRRLGYCLEQIELTLGSFRRGVAAFSDPDFSARRQPEDWLLLKQLGLNYLVIGLETGWPPLRGQLGKAADLSAVRQAVAKYKQAGISVGITLLTGACPLAQQAVNREQTCRFLADLELAAGDRVYLSPLTDSSFDSLGDLDLFRELLRTELKVQVVAYQMQRFHYFA